MGGDGVWTENVSNCNGHLVSNFISAWIIDGFFNGHLVVWDAQVL